MDPELEQKILSVIPPDELAARAAGLGMTTEQYMAAIMDAVVQPERGIVDGTVPEVIHVKPKQVGPRRWKPAKARPR